MSFLDGSPPCQFSHLYKYVHMLQCVASTCKDGTLTVVVISKSSNNGQCSACNSLQHTYMHIQIFRWQLQSSGIYIFWSFVGFFHINHEAEIKLRTLHINKKPQSGCALLSSHSHHYWSEQLYHEGQHCGKLTTCFTLHRGVCACVWEHVLPDDAWTVDTQMQWKPASARTSSQHWLR